MEAAMANDYEVIIVGSGVAGALCAWKLVQDYHDRKILILEAGDNEITQGQRIEFHHTMNSQGNRGDMYAPYMDLESRFFAPVAEKAQRELADQKRDPNNYYEYTGASKDAFKAGYNRMVGGSTWAWRGNTPRFIPSDFKLKSKFGVGRDWPIDYHELEPWYCEAENELGVSGNHEELDGLLGAYRSRRFPMRGIPLGYSDQRIKQRIDGKTARGTKIRVVTTPQARNTADYDGRPACEGHSNCIPLCPIQAKYDASAHLRKLRNRVELRKGVVVTRLEKGTDGKVSNVYYKDWRSDDPQKERSVSGKVIVLAAHAIETPKILLMSNLANQSGQVGRNLMDHIQFEVTAFFPEPLFQFRGPQSITAIDDFRDGPFRKTRSGFRMTIGNDGWGRAGSPSTVIGNLLKAGTYGSALPPAISDQIPKMLRLSFSTEMLADPANRIELSSNKDALGIPRPLFTFDIGEYVRAALREGFETSKELFALMGATVTGEQTMPEGKWNTAAHIMGTCIMGDDPKTSVVNPWGRTHDIPNLWIVGSSVFSTSATANPTLTLAALSLRTAAAINRQGL
jgi:choline dehydrogenase-like flavoprotein